MSNNRGLAEKLPTLDSPPQENAAPIRPKVMRRPAQFSDARPKTLAPSIVMPAPSALDENEDLALATPASQSNLTQKAWQDDVHFGIAMLTIVVLVNLGLMAWLPHMRPVPVAPAEQKQEATNSGTVTTLPDRSLTFYTKPGIDPIVTTPSQPTPEARVLGGADSGPNQ